MGLRKPKWMNYLKSKEACARCAKTPIPSASIMTIAQEQFAGCYVEPVIEG